jgi:hypothetical protein
MVRTPAGGAAGGKSVGKQQAAGKSAIAKPVHGGKASPAKTALPLGATIAPPHVAAVIRDGIAVAMNEGKPDVIRSVMADVHEMLSRLPGGERVAALALILHEMALSGDGTENLCFFTSVMGHIMGIAPQDPRTLASARALRAVTVQVLRAILALNDDAYTAVLGAGFGGTVQPRDILSKVTAALAEGKAVTVDGIYAATIALAAAGLPVTVSVRSPAGPWPHTRAPHPASAGCRLQQRTTSQRCRVCRAMRTRAAPPPRAAETPARPPPLPRQRA